MKKRSMKKWIPKDTCYCYDSITNKACKWWNKIGIKQYDESNCEHYNECETRKCKDCSCIIVYCKYLNYIDDKEDSLLWDMVKECGLKDDIKLFKRRRVI